MADVSTEAERYYQRGSELEQMYWNRWPSYWDPSPWESPPPWLGPPGEDITMEDARVWYRKAAALGSVRAITALARFSDGEERRHWLRQAVEHRENDDDSAMIDLARDYHAAGMLAEAEEWYRYALDHGWGSAAYYLTRLLMKLGRLDEAEQLMRPLAEVPDPGPGPTSLLAEILELKGQTEQAARLRAQIVEVRVAAMTGPPEDVIAVVVATMAVVPFLQAIATRAGDDAYAAIRAMVRWLWRRGREQPGAPRVRRPEDRLLVVEDPDPKLRLAITLGTDTPDHRLRALRDLDIDAITDGAENVLIEWHEPSQSWRTAGE